ncbi:MAG TPA: hypothetical protein VIE66_18740 [Methylocella sp.]
MHWLSPDCPILRLGTPKEKAELELVGGAMGAEVEAAKAAKIAFPPDDIAPTAAVMSALAVASAPLDVGTVAARFKQGRRIAPKVAAVLAALARMGFVDSADGGKTFALRRAA